MLDVLAELLIELFQGKDPKKKAAGQPARRPAPPPRQNDWPARSADDPYAQDHPSDQQAASGGGIEDILRRMHEMASMGGPDAPVLDPGFEAPPPVEEFPVAPPPVKTYTPGPTPRKTPAIPLHDVQTVQKKTGSDLEFVAALRNNPEAARQAFVYSEIFGRPLGERE